MNEFCGSEYYDNTIAWERPEIKDEEETEQMGDAFVDKLKQMLKEIDKKQKKSKQK